MSEALVVESDDLWQPQLFPRRRDQGRKPPVTLQRDWQFHDNDSCGLKRRPSKAMICDNRNYFRAKKRSGEETIVLRRRMIPLSLICSGEQTLA